MTPQDRERKLRRQKERRSHPTAIPQAWKRLGVTRKTYDEMYDLQMGRCAICGKKKKRYKPGRGRNAPILHVDHCHKTQRVRGLLCFSCNHKLGFVEKYGKRIVRYLRGDS